MRRIIRLTESDLHRIVNEAVIQILTEDGEGGAIGGGGATNCAGTMQGGGTNPGAGTYDVPAFGGIVRRKIDGKTNKKKKINNKKFIKPALDTSPGFSVNGNE